MRILLACQLASPQLKTGTILFINFSPDDLTVAADGRMTLGNTGRYEDTECKISAFGNKFVFAMAGGVFTDAGRNPHSIARQIWTTESRLSKAQQSSYLPLPKVDNHKHRMYVSC